jgi:hypothetical protein
MKHSINIIGESQRHRAIQIIAELPLVPVHEVVIRERKSTRSIEQNARMWAMLTDIATQVIWHGNRLTPENWKDVFSASLKQQQVVPGLDGGFVVMGQRTSKMTIAEMGDLMELMTAFGVQRGVKFTDPQEEF